MKIKRKKSNKNKNTHFVSSIIPGESRDVVVYTRRELPKKQKKSKIMQGFNSLKEDYKEYLKENLQYLRNNLKRSICVGLGVVSVATTLSRLLTIYESICDIYSNHIKKTHISDSQILNNTNNSICGDEEKNEKNTGYDNNDLETKVNNNLKLIDFEKISNVIVGYDSTMLADLSNKINSYIETFYEFDKKGFIDLDSMYRIAATFESKVKEVSEKYKVPLEVSLGILLIENSGRYDAFSPTENAGIYQLSELVATYYGLDVDERIDERFMPDKAIDAAINYMADLHRKLGRWDFVMLAYHQGETQVKKMISMYLKNNGQDIPYHRINPNIIQKYNVNLYNMLSDDSIVNTFFDTENPISGLNYVWKVLALYLDYTKNSDNYIPEKIGVYEVKPGDTLYEIARKLNFPQDLLEIYNSHLKDPRNIRPGDFVFFPIQEYSKNNVKIKGREM